MGEGREGRGKVSARAEKLLGLARARFGELTDADVKLFSAVADGQDARYQTGNREEDDPKNAEKWGEERRLGADRIVWLCTDDGASQLVTHQGIQMLEAQIEGELMLRFAKIRFPLAFRRCRIPRGINLTYSRVEALALDGTWTGPIAADGVRVAGDVNLRNGFKTEREVQLFGARIAGNLDCEGGEFKNKSGYALSADRVKVEENVILGEGFKAVGEVRLVGARIGGDLDCQGGEFRNGGGRALSADRVQVEGSLFLREGFRAEGEVRLLVARIGGSLDCEGGEFRNKSGNALSADGLKVAGNVYLRKGFKAEGRISLVRAEVGGMACWTGVKEPETAELNLSLAKAAVFWYDESSWPEKGKLHLHGFVYDELGEDAPRERGKRIEWLCRQPDKPFSTQPYEQMAAVLRKGGDEEGAREVLIAKAKDVRKYGKVPWWEWILWYSTFGWLIGYGYRPLRVFWPALGFVVLGCVVFWLAWNNGIMEATHNVHQNFFAPMYSVDAFVPVVDFGQEGEWVAKAGSVGGWLVVGYYWFHVAAGWVLTTLFVVGLTKRVRE